MSDAAKPSGPAPAGPPAGLPYIICVNLQDEPACVVGGGKVAARKVESLLEAGAVVHVIAERVCEDIRSMLADPAVAGRVLWQEGPYQGALPAGCRIVIACTDNRQVNRQVREACRARGGLCNVVDDPELCDFIVPAVRRVGKVQIAVSTGGASPTLARDLVERLAGQTDPAVADLAQLLADIRLEVQAEIPDTGRRKALFAELSGGESLRIYKEAGKDGWRQWFQQRLAHYQR